LSVIVKFHCIDQFAVSTSFLTTRPQQLRNTAMTSAPLEYSKDSSLALSINHGYFESPAPDSGNLVQPIEDDQPSVASMATNERKSSLFVVFLIMSLGSAACGAFLAVGIKSALDDQKELFERNGEDFVKRIQRSWDEYQTAAAWIHGRCRDRNFTRADFRVAYEYLMSSGLDFQAMQFDPNITNEERPAAEEDARKFYEDYPSVDYRGFVGFNYDNSTSLDPRLEADFYFPIHYMEPVVGNERAIDLDYHASGSRKQSVMYCMEQKLPALTDRLTLVQETTESAFGVVLMHPGVELSTTAETDEVWPRDLASIVIRIPDLLRRAADDTHVSLVAYIYDNSEYAGGPPRFLGGAKIQHNEHHEEHSEDNKLSFAKEIDIEEVLNEDVPHLKVYVEAANKVWIVVVQPVDTGFNRHKIYVLVGGSVIFLASMCLAYWIYTNSKRIAAFNRVKQEAEAERASLILESARQATKAERELNDFIAHEVSDVLSQNLLEGHQISRIHFVPLVSRYGTQLPLPCRHVAL